MKKALTYANGYRELGMFDDALQELEALGPEYHDHNMVKSMQLGILMEAKRWKKALPIANLLASRDSSDPGNLINLAYVTRRASSLDGAKVILENALSRFPEEAIIHYNLACYHCCSAEIDKAKQYLENAFRLDESYVEMAAKDEDLKALGDWLSAR